MELRSGACGLACDQRTRGDRDASDLSVTAAVNEGQRCEIEERLMGMARRRGGEFGEPCT